MIYLDNSSTTKPLPQVAARVFQEMEEFGNPSSLHRLGVAAEKRLKDAKTAVGATLGLPTDNYESGIAKSVFFTSGGTESDNTAVFGMAEAGKKRGMHLITTQIEHPAVLEAMKVLEARGFRVTYLSVDRFGNPDLAAFEDALSEDTIGVSVMAVNNELGTVLPIAEMAQLTHRKTHALFHTDGVQAYGKVSFLTPDVDLASISGHKVHGPKGIGALYVRSGVHVPPFVYGGGQEKHFRSGTENMPGIVGLGAAAEVLLHEGAARATQMGKARDYLRKGLLDRVPDITINSPENGCPAVLNVSFLGCRSEVLLHTLEQKEIYVSTGSACSSNSSHKGSHVLKACGLTAEQIEGAVRFSFCGDNTLAEMDEVLDAVEQAVKLQRRLQHR